MIQRASRTSVEAGTSDRMYKELLIVIVFNFFIGLVQIFALMCQNSKTLCL